MKIAIIDFRSTFTNKIGEALERVGAEYSYFPYNTPAEEIVGCDGIIFTGSYDTVYDGGKLAERSVLECGLPILGICYGHQLVHYMLGGKVTRAKTPEHEPVRIDTVSSPLFEGLPASHIVSMHHNDEVVTLAEGFKKIAESENCFYAASQNIEKKIYTVQFHPEDVGNEYGDEIFRNYLRIIENKTA
ncbi:MAG: gamma-glutamyl-gamma-aminobutyrate hydrolase family protein [Erysipelotrichaceae bacterium]|nr:gamma-glutamyl-gamma-aminobutyrate hydrolase family protein [Erysipelotrichaceae bacterium]